MSLVRLLLNILWVLTGGLWMAAAWVIAGILLALTIVGLPWARAAFNIAGYTLLPFGYRVVRRDEYTGRNDLGTGPLGFLGNLIWFLLAGWWLALGHLVTAVVLAITIIGIPFAWAHLKLAGLALWPIGKMIVPVDALPAGRGYAAWGQVSCCLAPYPDVAPGVFDDSRRGMVGLGKGGCLLRGFASAVAPSLLAAVTDVAASAPFRRMATPRGTMSVAMTSYGSVGFMSDKAGYRYGAVDPVTGQPQTKMPAVFRNVAAQAATA